jgi:hypothetical protein
MVGGLLSVFAHSPTAGFLVGASTWGLAHLYGRAGRHFVEDGAHVVADDFRRRWHAL